MQEQKKAQGRESQRQKQKQRKEGGLGKRQTTGVRASRLKEEKHDTTSGEVKLRLKEKREMLETESALVSKPSALWSSRKNFQRAG